MGAGGRLIAAGLGLVLLLFVVLFVRAALVTRVIHWPVYCEGPSPNWDDPYHGIAATQVADLREAAPYLAFTSVVPKGLGPPAKILIVGTKPDMSAKSVLSVYQQPEYGRFWVTETVPKVTDPAWIESQTNNPTGCSQDSVVTLRSGARAALSVGRKGTSIMWLEHGLLIDLYGQTFTKDQAIELANRV